VRVAIIEPGDFKTGIHTARRLSQATKEGVYATAFDLFLRKRRDFEDKATTAEPVAAAVERILDEPAPAMRAVVAMPSQRLLLLVNRFAPQRVYEWCMRKILGQ
jgi:hypothetical protein